MTVGEKKPSDGSSIMATIIHAAKSRVMTSRRWEYGNLNTVEPLQSRRFLAVDPADAGSALDDRDDQVKEATYLELNSSGYAGGSWHGAEPRGTAYGSGSDGGWAGDGDDNRPAGGAASGMAFLGYFGSAWPIGGRYAAGASAEGSIEWPTDVDMYSLDLSENETLEFRSHSISAASPTLIRLFDNRGAELAAGEWVDASRNRAAIGSRGAEASFDNRDSAMGSSRGTCSLRYQFAEGGRYYVGVSGLGNDAYDAVEGTDDKAGAIGDYLLTVQTMRGLCGAGNLFSAGISVSQQPTWSAATRSAPCIYDVPSLWFSAADRSGTATDGSLERGVDGELWFRILGRPNR